MIHVRVREREAQAKATEPITAGSVGMPVTFRFDASWDGLAKCAVFSGSGEDIDVLLNSDSCVVPAEVLQYSGGHLKIGVFGCVVDIDNDVTTKATPTIWADAGPIREGAEPSGVDPSPETASLVEQILEACQDAEALAQSVRDDADNGAFDGEKGFSPLVSFENVPGGYLLTIRDILGEHSRVIYNGVNGDDGVSPEVTITDITGGHRVTITDAEHPDGQSFDVLDGSGGGGVTVDDEISGSSTNPVQNKVIKAALDAKGTYSKPSGGIPKTDLASAVQTSLGKADTALQSAPVTSVNNQTGAVSLSIPSTAGDVGAIPAPGSPSAGDVLTYSGSAWAAAAPAHQIPAGGNAGECLAKNSSSDYDLRWRTINDWTPAGLMRTAGGTAAKVAEWSLWSATQYPAWLVVTVGNSNTYAGAITLKVNGSTAYPIYINGEASSATNYSLPAGSYFVYFDGTKFDFRTDGKLPGDIIGHADKDIQAPASPTTGDFLVWNGSAWAATSLSAWQGGSY